MYLGLLRRKQGEAVSNFLWWAGLSNRRTARAGLRSSPNATSALNQAERVVRFWGCFAAQRGASPLTTKALSPQKLDHQMRPARERGDRL